MLNTANLVTFIATAKSAESLNFYKDTLGLEQQEDTPYALVFSANGTIIRIQKVESVMPPPYTVLGWQVGDIAATMQGLSDNGVTFERFDQLPQDELGIWVSPGGASVAWFKDPDGNILSLTQAP